jgi:hypothetical protein
MTVNHAHFEVLCALAASGQLTNTELTELREHSERCSACSSRLVEMTQLSAQLFCAHALNQPGIRMPENMLGRFIARANCEGVPLSPHAASAGASGPGLTAALLLALLLASATLHFRLPTKSGDEMGRGDVASASRSLSDEGGAWQGAPGNAAPDEARASRTPSRQKATHNGRGTSLPVARNIGQGRLSGIDSTGPGQSQFDLAVYSRNLTMFSRPFLVTTKYDRIIAWSSARYGAPKLDFAQPPEFAKDDPPRLFAEYEDRTFAPWSPQNHFAPAPPDAQTLRRDFDPDAYGTLLSPDLKGRPPAFQFTRESSQ